MDVIIAKLSRLKQLDPRFEVFGAAAHEYTLNPPLSEIEIASVESKYRCRLPEEYRAFLLNIGNGGAGPFYGLFPLGMQDDNFGLCSWEAGYLLGDLSAPFRFNAAWNASPEFLGQQPQPDENTSEEDENRMWEEWDEKLEAEYWAPEIMDGAIPICDEGCALRDWLVVTGPLAGTVWKDYRSDLRGVEPYIGSDGAPMSFRNWYLQWLDDSINAVLSRADAHRANSPLPRSHT